MNNTKVKEKIKSSLLSNRTDINRKYWANYIIENNIDLSDLIEIVLEEKPVSSQFIWMIGDICEINPVYVSTVIKSLFKLRDKVKIKNYNRSLAKIFWLAGIPKDIEGEAVTELFNWLSSSSELVQTKNYSLLALADVIKDHNELREELKIITQNQIKINPISFRKTANKVFPDIDA